MPVAVCHWMKRRREWISKVSFTDFVRRTNWMKHREAYKDIAQVIANERDLVKPLVELAPMAVIKG